MCIVLCLLICKTVSGLTVRSFSWLSSGKGKMIPLQAQCGPEGG